MRLLIATPLYPPESGGPATYAKILETELPLQGVEVGLVKFGEFKKYPKVIRHILYFFALLKALKDSDVLLALDPVSTGFPAALAAGVMRKTFVVKIVGDYAWEQGTQRSGITATLDVFVQEKRVPFQVACMRSVQRFVANRAVRVIVPSEYLKRIVQAWRIPGEKIEVIPNAQPKGTVGVVPEIVSSLSRPRIVSVARLVPWKGMDGVIDMVASLKEEMPEVSLVIVGNGPERERLTRKAEGTLGSSALLTGELSHGETLAVIKDADLFVLNSTYEGLSHLLIEALSLGAAVVATNVGGNPELIKDQENGLLIPSGDQEALERACRKVLKDLDLKEKIRAAAPASVSGYTQDIMIERTIALLHSLV
ncbi:MAG: hypothetical protein JWN64_11 [Parcubacteria group bacterium]|nr:hypothetical protein [Parcubacteria group bacterium]